MSLYRKYRPQTFEDVVGQEHVAQTLRNALSATPLRVAHAYLFCGPRGTGKTSNARLLAKCLNCENGPTPTPCNTCDFCVKVSNNQPTMDLIEMDAASNRKIENAREIIAGVNVAPASGRYRIYIIDEVHMLTPEAFNALLKTLEEPPAHAIFILATTDAHKVPITISSRCQHFNFRRVGPRDIVSRLQYVAQSEGLALSDDAARLIAHTADGALRDALTLLEQVSAFSESIEESDVRLVLGTVSQELLDGLIGAVASRDAAGVLGFIERAVEEGASFSQLARDLIGYCRDLLLLTVGYEGTSTLTDHEKKTRHHFANMLGHARIMGTIELLRAAEKETRENTNHRLLMELALVRASGDQFNLTTASAPAASTLAAVKSPAPVGLASPSGFAAPRAAPSTPAPMEAAETSSRPQPVWRQPVENQSAQNPPLQNQAPQKTEVAEQAAPQENAPVENVAATAPAETSAYDESSYAESTPAADTSNEPSTSENLSGESVAPAPPDSALQPQVSASKKKGRRIHTMEEFTELWPAVLMRVRKKIGITAVAYLHDALPYQLTASDAVLEFQKEFHFEKACEAAKEHPFEKVLNECLDVPRRLKFRLAERKPEPVKVEEEKSEATDDDDEEEDIFAVAQQLFAGEVMSRSGDG